MDWLFLAIIGFSSGILAGFLGIGGGVVVVPLLQTLGLPYEKAIASSSLAIVITSVSGSFQNWHRGYLKLSKVILLGLPGIFTTLMGTYLVAQLPEYLLKIAFGCLLFVNIYLTNLRQKIITQLEPAKRASLHPVVARVITGGLGGFLAGFFGVGGGVVLVPLQIILLGEKIKFAIQTSLAVICITSISACLGHYQNGNIVFWQGIIVGFGGLIGVQISSYFLPKLPERYVNLSFKSLLLILGLYSITSAWL